MQHLPWAAIVGRLMERVEAVVQAVEFGLLVRVGGLFGAIVTHFFRVLVRASCCV
jgi:hypothetical protein